MRVAGASKVMTAITTPPTLHTWVAVCGGRR